jgi:hypothetical protein
MPKIDYIPVGDYLLPAITLRDPPNAKLLTKEWHDAEAAFKRA